MKVCNPISRFESCLSGSADIADIEIASDRTLWSDWTMRNSCVLFACLTAVSLMGVGSDAAFAKSARHGRTSACAEVVGVFRYFWEGSVLFTKDCGGEEAFVPLLDAPNIMEKLGLRKNAPQTGTLDICVKVQGKPDYRQRDDVGRPAYLIRNVVWAKPATSSNYCAE